MILSNRKLKLIITALLLTIFMYFISIFDVKAANLDNFSKLESFAVTFSPNTNRMGFQTAILGENYQTYSQDYSFVNGTITINKNYDYLILPVETYWNVASSNGQQNDVKMSVLIGLRTNNGVNYCDYSQDNNMATCPFGITGSTQVQKVLIQYTFTRFGYSTGEIGYGAMIGTSWYGANINSNTQIVNNTNNINNSVNNVDSTLNSSDIDTSNSNTEIDSWSSNLPTNNTISNLITMPITLVRAYLNGFNSSCSSFNLGSLMGTNLVLPCINLSQKLGSIWSIIDVLMSGFMIFAIAKRMIKVFNDLTSLKDNQVDSVFGGGN